MRSGLKLFRFQNKNNALEERPEGVTTKGNSWGWASVKQKYQKPWAFPKKKEGGEAEVLTNPGLSTKQKRNIYKNI